MVSIRWSDESLDNLKKIEKTIAIRIIKKISWAALNLKDIVPDKLSANLAGFCKLRVGDYRVVYSVSENGLIVTIEWIGHRRDVYTR